MRAAESRTACDMLDNARQTSRPALAMDAAPTRIAVGRSSCGGSSPPVWLDFMGLFGVANRVSDDLRAERDAFIADENAS